MGLIDQLLPKSSAYRGPNLRIITAALQKSFDRLTEFCQGIVTESHPTTAVQTIGQWDTECPMYTASGGQNLEYLQAQLQQRWPDIYLTMFSFDDANMCGSAQCGEEMCADIPLLGPSYPVHYYYVRGAVDNRTKFNKLQAIIVRLVPAHMTPLYQVSITSENPSSMAGVAESGVAQCGN